MKTKIIKIIFFSSALLYAALFVGCATQLYWVQPGKNLRETSVDLLECRRAAQPRGGSQVYSAADLERPCMAAKGYGLSKTPPKE